MSAKQTSPPVVSVKPPSTSSDLSSLDGSDEDEGGTEMEGVEASHPPSLLPSSLPLVNVKGPNLIAPPQPSTFNAAASSSSSDQILHHEAGPEAAESTYDPPPSAYRPPAPRSLSSALSPPADSSPSSSPGSTTEPLPASPRSSPPPPPEQPSATTSRIRPFPKDKKRRQQPPQPQPPPIQDEEDDEEEEEEEEEDPAQPVASGSGTSNQQGAVRVSGMWNQGEEEGDSDLTPDEDDDQDEDDDEGTEGAHRDEHEEEADDEEDDQPAPSSKKGSIVKLEQEALPARRRPNGIDKSPAARQTSTSSSSSKNTAKGLNGTTADSPSSSSTSSTRRQAPANSRPAPLHPRGRRTPVATSKNNSSASSDGTETALTKPTRSTVNVKASPSNSSARTPTANGAKVNTSATTTSGGSSSKTTGGRKRALSASSQQGPIASELTNGALTSPEGKRRMLDGGVTLERDEDEEEEEEGIQALEGGLEGEQEEESGGQTQEEGEAKVATGGEENDEDEAARVAEEEHLGEEMVAPEDLLALINDEGGVEEAEVVAEELLEAGQTAASIPFALQHRQDAMEALTKIEITFARLRDRLHVERMEECLREEEALLDGSHPVLQHLQARLTSLRERELTVSTKRVAQVEAEYENVRVADVSAVWEWWRNGREELQRDMMADVMRKRRRVDREKRAVEGGRPKRPIPVPQPGAPPSRRRDRETRYPDMEDLLPGSYLTKPEERTRLREEREVWGPRPGLMGLEQNGRENDLELLGLGPSMRGQQAFRPFDQPPSGMMAPGPVPVHHHHHVLQQQEQQQHQQQMQLQHQQQIHPQHQQIPMHPQQHLYSSVPPQLPPPLPQHQQPSVHAYQYRSRSPAVQMGYEDPAYHAQAHDTYTGRQQRQRSASAMAPPPSAASSSRAAGRNLTGPLNGSSAPSSVSSAAQPFSPFEAAFGGTEPAAASSSSSKRRRTESPAVAANANPSPFAVSKPSSNKSSSKPSVYAPVEPSFLKLSASASRPPAIPIPPLTVLSNGHNPSAPAAGLSPSVLNPPPMPPMTPLMMHDRAKEASQVMGLGGFSFAPEGGKGAEKV